jgi:dTDP-4-amino-4,6-dideoxygalactose transaminase
MKKRYYHDFLGYNFRMTDLQAALGLAQLAKLEVFNEKRIANARYLTERLTAVIITPQVKDGYRHVFNQYTIRVRGDRDKIVEQLRERGIGAGIYYPLPVHKQLIYQELGYTDCLPVAEAMSREVLSLPVHPALSQADLEKIVEVVTQLQSEQVREIEISAGIED